MVSQGQRAGAETGYGSVGQVPVAELDKMRARRALWVAPCVASEARRGIAKRQPRSRSGTRLQAEGQLRVRMRVAIYKGLPSMTIVVP